MSSGKKCGACGHPQSPANDGYDRCPLCEGEHFFPSKLHQKPEVVTKVTHDLVATPPLDVGDLKQVLEPEA